MDGLAGPQSARRPGLDGGRRSGKCWSDERRPFRSGHLPRMGARRSPALRPAAGVDRRGHRRRWRRPPSSTWAPAPGETLARVLAAAPGGPRRRGGRERRHAGGGPGAPGGVTTSTLQVADLRDPLPAGPVRPGRLGPGRAPSRRAGQGDAVRPGGRASCARAAGSCWATWCSRADAAIAVIPLTDDWDKPSTVAEQVGWLEEAGLAADGAVAGGRPGRLRPTAPTDRPIGASAGRRPLSWRAP